MSIVSSPDLAEPTDSLGPFGSVVVVGASLAGLSAARSLRAEGHLGSITVIGDERHRPYDRPPLSKQYLADTVGSADLDSASLEDVDWILGVAAVSLDTSARVVVLADGREISYDGLVIATGAAPRVLPGFSRPGVHTLRTLDDAAALRDALRTGSPRVVLIGAGFIGAEIASTCRGLGLQVSMIEMEAVPFGRTLGVPVGAELTALYEREGVDVRAGRFVREIVDEGGLSGVILDDGSEIPADVVVLSIGVSPATAWLEGSGITLQNGVVCDETLRVGPRIVAAGDVANWPNQRLGETRRVEHWENAIVGGEHAARTLIGGVQPFTTVPWVWSDQFGFKLQFVGSSIDHDEVFVDSSLGAERGKLLALYRKGDRLLGACGVRRNKLVLSLRALVGQEGSWVEAMRAAGLVSVPE